MILINVERLGTSVRFMQLNEDSYHVGATGISTAEGCADRRLLQIRIFVFLDNVRFTGALPAQHSFTNPSLGYPSKLNLEFSLRGDTNKLIGKPYRIPKTPCPLLMR